MPKGKRVATWLAVSIQIFAVWFVLSRSEVWPYMIREKKVVIYLSVYLLYLFGDRLMHALVTSEVIRKSQLEADQLAAMKIQRTLQPDKLDPVAGYEMDSFYEPFRVVGGDYFDVIELPGNRTLIAVADVSGKGTPAALLAANIQGLVRTLANINADPLAMANHINKHLSLYTPSERFATAVFVLLKQDSGELTYVNAGHNCPIVSCAGSATSLEATGLPMGLFSGAEYTTGSAKIPSGGALLLFTDGLTDAIPGEDPASRLGEALSGTTAESMASLKSLIDPGSREDDITILLIRRNGADAAVARDSERLTRNARLMQG